MRRVLFEAAAFADFSEWAASDGQVHRRIIQLIRNTQREPFSGLGKPEPLRGPLKGYWSRRISHEHRLVYKVTDEAIVIAACRQHYD